MAAVDDDPSRVDVRYRSANDRKYVFPEPGIFLGANEVRRAKYFQTWKAIEPACVHRLLSSTAPALSNQEWRDILVGSLEFKSSDSACAKAREHACRLLGSAIDDLSLNTTDPATPPPPPFLTVRLRKSCGVCQSSTSGLSCLPWTSVQGQR